MAQAKGSGHQVRHDEMRRIGLQLGTGLLTFCLGVGAAWVFMPVSQPSEAELERPSLSETVIRPTTETPAATPSEPATIVFIRSHKNRHGVILAKFKVTNISNEPLSYMGVYPEPDWNRYYSVRRGSELEVSDRTCGTGLGSHTLLPGKSVMFKVVVGDEPGRVQVGFDFFVGESSRLQTVWGDEVYVSE